ncbi:MAG: hypothetical protein IT426_18920 [Pirellulales bacterium]|nr:hypothetical protein [Pirellulales bacterium]
MSDLVKIDFGLGAAQQEKNLKDYFYRSGSFQSACSEKTYLVLGAKGAGKSAIFKMFQELESEIKIFSSPNLWIHDEPQLRDHWTTLQKIRNSSEITLWRFYIASLIANYCLKQALPNELEKSFKRFLARWGLVREVPTKWQAMRSAPIKIDFAGIQTELSTKSPLEHTEIDYVIYSADKWLDDRGSDLWICLDTLDEVSLNGHSHDDVENLLSNMMRSVAELIRLKRIRIKLFFRTDIYHSLTYVNKDHFSALKLELRWSKEDLAIMLAHRLRVLHPGVIIPLDYPNSIRWIQDVFDWGTKPPISFDDLYELLKDGNGDVLPRDLINFCIQAQKAQENFNIQGIHPPNHGKLISCFALQKALQQTAASKLTDFLQVFQNFKDTYDQLKGGKSRHFTRDELSIALGKKEPLDAKIVIADLVRVGALAIKDKKAVNLSDSFEIPFLYAKALEIGDPDE